MKKEERENKLKEILNIYKEQNISISQLSEQFNISAVTISRYLNKHNIDIKKVNGTSKLKSALQMLSIKSVEEVAKEFEISDIKQITNEVMPNQPVIIQKVEVYEDTVSIISKDITDEQKSNLINKINEKYGTELSADSTQILTVPHTRGRDIIKPYIAPFLIATIIILIYMAIRYYKLGIINTILN